MTVCAYCCIVVEYCGKKKDCGVKCRGVNEQQSMSNLRQKVRRYMVRALAAPTLFCLFLFFPFFSFSLFFSFQVTFSFKGYFQSNRSFANIWRRSSFCCVVSGLHNMKYVDTQKRSTQNRCLNLVTCLELNFLESNLRP